MKNLITGCIYLLMAAIFLAVIPTEAESAVYDDTIRLHILANSDSKEDQELKLKVRDAVLREFSDELNTQESKKMAEDKISFLLKDIEAFSENIIASEGYSYSVRASLGDEWYDTREYDGFTLPSGIYTSLRIVIGEGEGKNWWCVMFPPLCLEMATDQAEKDEKIKKYSDEEISLINGKGYRIKFKLLEMFSEAFS